MKTIKHSDIPAPYVQATINTWNDCPFCGSDSVDDSFFGIETDEVEGFMLKYKCYDCHKVFYIYPGEYDEDKEEWGAVVEVRDSKQKLIYRKPDYVD